MTLAAAGVPRQHRVTPAGLFAVDIASVLELDGTRQRLRRCASRPGLPPVLVVQAGPGLPLLNEVTRFQRLLQLERDFTVTYWDQRGCGCADSRDAARVSLESQVSDVGAVVRHVAEHSRQAVIVVGVSLGATFALRAAARDAGSFKSLVAISIDTDIAAMDAAAHSYLEEAGGRPGQERVLRTLRKIGPPPYTTPSSLQARARLLTDLGGIEYGKRFGPLLRLLLASLVRSYGVVGALAALRNMSSVQRALLPALTDLNLLADWPDLPVPVHYLFGQADPLMPAALVERISAHATARDTLSSIPEAGHMVHFDAPALVRAAIIRADSTF